MPDLCTKNTTFLISGPMACTLLSDLMANTEIHLQTNK